MTKLTPKETNLIDDIVRSANPLFFGKLAKLLELPFPDTIGEKEKLLKHILGREKENEKLKTELRTGYPIHPIIAGANE